MGFVGAAREKRGYSAFESSIAADCDKNVFAVRISKAFVFMCCQQSVHMVEEWKVNLKYKVVAVVVLMNQLLGGPSWGQGGASVYIA